MGWDFIPFVTFNINKKARGFFTEAPGFSFFLSTAFASILPTQSTDPKGDNTSYTYNTLSQLTQKTSPDAGTVQNLYDKNGNLRFSQDANQAITGKVTFVTYDDINRPQKTGEAEAVFSTLDGHLTYGFESDSSNWVSLNIYDVTAPPNSFPWDLFDCTGITLNNTKSRIAATAYNTVGGGGDENIQNTTFNSTETIRGLGSVSTQGSVTVASAANVTFKAGSSITLGDGFSVQAGASFQAVIDSVYSVLQNSWQVTLFSYDNNGRVKNKFVFTACATSLDRTDFTYDYDRQGNVTHVKVLRGAEEIHHWNNFDERGLLKDVSVAQNSTQPTLVDFDFQYTPSGLVQSKKINETSAGVFNTTMSYQYHPRDWLTKINDVNSTAKPFGADYSYFDDGNIQTAKFYNQSSPTEPKYKYDFGYDARKQLTAANYFYDNGAGFQSAARFGVTGLSYDANGNIEKLVRKDETGAKVDSLTYNYTSGKNQLQTLIEDAGQTPVDWDAEDTDFTYDSNGNVKTVSENGSYKFKSIQYDTRNLPIFVEKGDGTEIIYLYSADGQRIFKKVDNNAGEHYILDGSLNVGVFTEDGSLKHWNMLADGVAGRIETSGRLYYLTDHLGSTRTVIDESGLVVESHDYYPFGLQMPGRDFLAVSVRTKELFTGKELDDETGLHYFGRRYYWGPGARWWSVDPLAEDTPSLTPYHYVRNNPINRFDSDGRADFGSAKKLKEVGMHVIAQENLKAIRNEDGSLTTFCNFGCQQILQAGGDRALDNMRANDIFDYLSNKEVATPLSYDEAVSFAKEGATVILASKETGKSGHVAIVAPENIEFSGSFGKDVPLVFNVGSRNSLMRASEAFKKSNQPTAFILNKDKESVELRKTLQNLVKEFLHTSKADKLRIDISITEEDE